MPDLSRFDYTTYKEILLLLSEQHTNLCFTDFRNDQDTKKYFILRHDVDYCTEPALRMAQIEKNMGLRATYFILMNSSEYNLLSPEHAAFPRQLTDMGHEVGLHYDVSAIEAQTRGNNLNDVFQAYADLLGTLSGVPVESVSMHNPAISGEGIDLKDSSFINAYNPQFVEDTVYISDSCGAWRNSANDLLTREKLPDKIQILVHPLWWGEKPLNRWERFEGFRNSIRTSNDKRHQWLIDAWRDHEGVIQHDSRYTKKN